MSDYSATLRNLGSLVEEKFLITTKVGPALHDRRSSKELGCL
jgi:hypothetical protein